MVPGMRKRRIIRHWGCFLTVVLKYRKPSGVSPFHALVVGTYLASICPRTRTRGDSSGVRLSSRRLACVRACRKQQSESPSARPAHREGGVRKCGLRDPVAACLLIGGLSQKIVRSQLSFGGLLRGVGTRSYAVLVPRFKHARRGSARIQKLREGPAAESARTFAFSCAFRTMFMPSAVKKQAWRRDAAREAGTAARQRGGLKE